MKGFSVQQFWCLANPRYFYCTLLFNFVCDQFVSLGLRRFWQCSAISLHGTPGGFTHCIHQTQIFAVTSNTLSKKLPLVGLDLKALVLSVCIVMKKDFFLLQFVTSEKGWLLWCLWWWHGEKIESNFLSVRPPDPISGLMHGLLKPYSNPHLHGAPCQCTVTVKGMNCIFIMGKVIHHLLTCCWNKSN